MQTTLLPYLSSNLSPNKVGFGIYHSFLLRLLWENKVFFDKFYPCLMAMLFKSLSRLLREVEVNYKNCIEKQKYII